MTLLSGILSGGDARLVLRGVAYSKDKSKQLDRVWPVQFAVVKSQYTREAFWDLDIFGWAGHQQWLWAGYLSWEQVQLFASGGEIRTQPRLFGVIDKPEERAKLRVWMDRELEEGRAP